VTAIKEFEDYFFDQRPRLAPEWIRVLFQGEDATSGCEQCGQCDSVVMSMSMSHSNATVFPSYL
jgi:hypothetical protein